MNQQQVRGETVKHYINWARFAIILVGMVVVPALLIWSIMTISKYRCRRSQQNALPRAFLLHAYIQRQQLAGDWAATHSPAQATTLEPPYLETPPPADNETSAPAHRDVRVEFPPQAHIRGPNQRVGAGRRSPDVFVLGSVQPRNPQRRSHIRSVCHRSGPQHSNYESVETLPRYQDPPSYKSDNGIGKSA
ncbi:hypothetical protein DDE83_008594 [Stemphylium lycopersici]|uniref:Uncharacterized protein n=1 Tax=Stemphylium lycopersici TaxID=183478 RepID=A0A364MT66_STELY|nr:hypothetical protein DDE83_008594 [Stemphylium lycopersici]